MDIQRTRSRKLFDESLSWIDANPGATNLDVREDLLEAWIHVVDDETIRPRAFHLAVFSFGLWRALAAKSPAGKIEISLSRLEELFHRWQLKLALAKLHRQSDLRFAPIPLFALSDEETVEYRMRGAG